MDAMTVKDVAKKARVSIATVSRVINRNYPVSDKLKQRVEDAIAELNYSPNSIARSLKTDKTGMIAFMVTDIANPFFTTIIRAAEDVVRLHNYNLIVCSTDNNQEKELAYLQMLTRKKMEGIVINTTGYNDDYICQMSTHTPIVLSNRKIDNWKFHGDFVDFDNITGAYQLTNHLICLGHRRIAVANISLRVSTGRERFMGFCNAMRQIDIDPTVAYALRFDSNINQDDGYKAAEYLLQLSPRPTAIVVMNNLMTIGVLKYCAAHNVRIPEDLSVVSFGDLAHQELFAVQPTGLSLNLESLGNRIGELLLSRINSDTPAPNQEVRYSSILVEGNSTAAPSSMLE